MLNEKKYLNTPELFDLYQVLIYIISNNVNKNKQLLKYDLALLKRVKNYMSDNTCDFDIEYINRFLDNFYIVYLLKKIMSIRDYQYLDQYLSMCKEDTSEFQAPKRGETFEKLDAYDLFLYYQPRKKIKTLQSQRK
jgi:hypothetical protein